MASTFPSCNVCPSLEELHALRLTLCTEELDQSHLFTTFPSTPDLYTEHQLSFLNELYAFRHVYPGGVEAYIRTGRQLLDDQVNDTDAQNLHEPKTLEPNNNNNNNDNNGGAKAETAVLDFVAPQITSLDMPPLLYTVPPLRDQYLAGAPPSALQALEERGTQLLPSCAFVLVAGGLGERLGYSDIKLNLPVETTTGRTYLEHYATWVQQVGREQRSAATAPEEGEEQPPLESKSILIIMTSDDTHAKTIEAIAHLKEGPSSKATHSAASSRIELPEIFVLKQEMVFCFKDSAAHLAVQYTNVPPFSDHATETVPSNKPVGKDPYFVLPKKPHGHGDVHTLLHEATVSQNHLSAFLPHHDLHAPPTKGNDSLLDYLLNVQKKKHIVFFQDTNATSVLTIPVSLAISEVENLAMNCTCIPRKPKESIGLLCSVQTANDEEDDKKDGEEGDDGGGGAAAVHSDKSKKGRWRTALVEYNIFEDIAKNMFSEEAEEEEANATKAHKEDGRSEAGSDADGPVTADDKSALLSPFPGSINTLILKLPAYYRVVRKTKGKVPEFINPKYENESKRAFRSPARLESLMQDIALLFENHYDIVEDPAGAVSPAPPPCKIVGDRIGGTVFPRWTYAPVKNNFDEVEKKVRAHMEPYGATSAEEKYYDLIRARLCAVGVRLPTLSHRADGGSPLESDAWIKTKPDVFVSEAVQARLLPNIVVDPGALSLAALRRMFPHPQQVHIAERSTLIVEGNVVIDSLTLSGALKVIGPPLSERDGAPTEGAAPLLVKGVTVQNEGWQVRAVRSLDTEEVSLMRGFVFERRAMHIVDSSTDLSKL